MTSQSAPLSDCNREDREKQGDQDERSYDNLGVAGEPTTHADGPSMTNVVVNSGVAAPVYCARRPRPEDSLEVPRLCAVSKGGKFGCRYISLVLAFPLVGHGHSS